MEKIKIIQEAFEKAKELYWEEGKTVSLSVDFWKYSTGEEKVKATLWVDPDARNINSTPDRVFGSESFQELLDFLGIKEPEGDPRFTTFDEIHASFGDSPPVDEAHNA